MEPPGNGRPPWAASPHPPSKILLTAVHRLHNDIPPFFEAHSGPIETILSDNSGREFCVRPGRHPSESFLPLAETDHRTTRVRRPQSNGFLERFHRALLDEPLRIQGRARFYEDLPEGRAKS